MIKIQELQEQAGRAERLARSILDSITVERLLAYAAERRAGRDGVTPSLWQTVITFVEDATATP